MLKRVVERQYYTNHGPLVQELEERLQDILGVKHAICVTNCTIGLMVLIKAKEFKECVCPAFTFKATAQALEWCGVDINYQDVGDDHLLHGEFDSPVIGVHLWGNECRARGTETIFDAAHAFAQNYAGDCVYSFHATKLLNAAEGGCIATNDDDLAEKCRNIRSSYGVRESIPRLVTANGRMSEAQAGMALLGLDHLKEYERHNDELREVYKSLLPIKDTKQYIVIETDQREKVIKRLAKKGFEGKPYFPPLADLPNTKRLSEQCLVLPHGQHVTVEDVEKICALV